MKLWNVNPFEGCTIVKMAPVTGDKPFGPNGESEDNTFARYTPSGSLELAITNPDLLKQFAVGQEFYLDFVPIPSAVHTEATLMPVPPAAPDFEPSGTAES